MKLVVAALAFAAGADAKEIPAYKCAMKNCALKSPFATAGPGFQDGVRFFSVGSDGKDTRVACPFGNDDDPEPSKKEYMKYMKQMNKVAEMPVEERRAYALAHQQEMIDRADDTIKVVKPSVDVAAPGVEEVTSKDLEELRNYNEYDFLVTFYAPWCPHCKNFVTAENAPIKALDAALMKVKGPKVVSFDITDTNPPAQLGINSVPTVYLFKKTGEAIEFEGDVSDAKGIMSFAMGKKAAAALVQKPEASHKCKLEDCKLTSNLASAGPAVNALHFISSTGKDSRIACPFGGDEGPEPTKKEYMKYMNALDEVGDMTPEQRRAWAVAHANDPLPEEPKKKIKPPSVHLSESGVHAVNSTTWSELRNANKYDMLITFYAPWCPHCKAFVTAANAPINALSASLEKVNGPKVVSFDMIADDPPLTIDAVPTIYLFRTDGMAIPFEGEAQDMEALMAFTLDNATPKKAALVEKKITKHLRA